MSERGSTLVETAIVLSLLLVLVFGMVDFGRYVAMWHGVNSAAREGARYGIAVGPSSNGIPRFTDCSEITDAAIELSGLAELTTSDVSVTFDNGSGVQVHDCAGGDPAASSLSKGDRVVVTVTRAFTAITPFGQALLGPRTITATDSRTIFTDSAP